jgi:hypothetical protein
MAFDPSVISSIPDGAGNPIKAKGDAYTLASLIDDQQLGRMKLNQAKSEQEDLGKIKAVLNKADISTFEGQNKAAEAATRINPKLGMDLQRNFAQRQSAQYEKQDQDLKIYVVQQDHIAGALDSVLAEADQLRKSGASDAMVNATITKSVLGAKEQLSKQTLPNGQPVWNASLDKALAAGPLTYDRIKALEMQSNKGQELLKQRLAERHQQVGEAQETERERHDRAMEANATTKTGLTKAKAERDSSGGLTDKARDELADQALTGDTGALVGLSKADKASVRNRMADVAEIRGLKGGDVAAKNAEFFGIKAGERALGTRQAQIDTAANEADKLIPIALEASEKVPRGKMVPWNKLFQIAEKGDSDPNLYAFAQAARSLANVYTRAVVPGASGVADREESIASLPIYTDQVSFKAVTDIMKKEIAAAKASPREVRQGLGESITGRDPQPIAPASAPVPGAKSGEVVHWDDLK